MRLAARIGKLEAKIPPPMPGCDRCRRPECVLGLGEYEQRAGANGRWEYVCTACGRDVSDRKLIAIDLRGVL